MSTTTAPALDNSRAAAMPRRVVRVFDHLLAALPTLWLALFFLAPLAFTVVFSFGHAEFGAVALGFTLDNYRQALSGFYLQAFLRTLQFAATGCVLCLAVAYPAAYFIARHAGRHRGIALALVLVPYFTSFLIRVMSWQILLARGGAVEAVLNTLRLHQGPLDVMDTQTAVFIGMVYAYLPIAIVPLYLVLIRIPGRLAEASRDLGAAPWQTFLNVTLPLSRPGIATAALLTGVPMLGELVIPTLLGGGRGVLMGQAISSQYLDSQNYALGSAMAVLVLVAVAVIVALLARLTRGFAEIAA
ncbi:MAG TPA: ABC transporter permease [Devosia sp.]|nr:ABC transporter permease [Devosia sp.]